MSETARRSAGNDVGGRSTGRVVAAAVLVVVGILLIIAAIIYFTTDAKSLPSILGTIKHPTNRANSTRSLRGIVSLVVGVVLFAGAWFAYFWKTRGAKDV